MAKGTVLIVDQNDDSRGRTAGILSSAGFETISTHQCVADVLRDTRERPDLIVLDACRRCHCRGRIEACLCIHCTVCEIPVIVLNASTRSEDHDCAFRAGVKKYLLRPCDPIELKLAVEELVERTQAGVGA